MSLAIKFLTYLYSEASEGKRLGAREVSGDRMLSDEIEKDVFLENIYGEDESSGFNRDEFNEWIDNNPGIKREINEEEELEEEDGDERRYLRAHPFILERALLT